MFRFRVPAAGCLLLSLAGCESVSTQTMSLAADLAEVSSGVVCDTAQSIAQRTRNVERMRHARRMGAANAAVPVDGGRPINSSPVAGRAH